MYLSKPGDVRIWYAACFSESLAEPCQPHKMRVALCHAIKGPPRPLSPKLFLNRMEQVAFLDVPGTPGQPAILVVTLLPNRRTCACLTPFERATAIRQGWRAGPRGCRFLFSLTSIHAAVLWAWLCGCLAAILRFPVACTRLYPGRQFRRGSQRQLQRESTPLSCLSSLLYHLVP